MQSTSYKKSYNHLKVQYITKFTLFLQSLFRVPHLHSSEHSTLFPLQGQPQIPFSLFFTLQELLQSQRLVYIKVRTQSTQQFGSIYANFYHVDQGCTGFGIRPEFQHPARFGENPAGFKKYLLICFMSCVIENNTIRKYQYTILYKFFIRGIVVDSMYNILLRYKLCRRQISANCVL